MDEAVNSPTDAPTATKGSRKERASATRSRILAAAEAEFVANSYHATLMTDIAKRAGVSVQMLYFSFGTKAKLMGAVVDNAVLGGVSPVDPIQSEWYEQVKDASTASETIRRFIVGGGPVFQRASAVSLIGRAGGLTDLELGRISRAGEELRAAGFKATVELATTKGPLKAGLQVRTATDILVAVYSPALYVEFTSDRGWSHAQTMDWLASSVPGLICGD